MSYLAIARKHAKGDSLLYANYEVLGRRLASERFSAEQAIDILPIELDSQGYSCSGRYFGVGMPLFSVSYGRWHSSPRYPDEVYLEDDECRAPSVEDLKAFIQEVQPNATFEAAAESDDDHIDRLDEDHDRDLDGIDDEEE